MVFLGLWIRGFWFTEVFRLHKSNASNRSALLQIRNAVPLGAPHAEVLAAYWRHRTDDLRLMADQPDWWLVRMPLEWGASDWTLSITFEDDRATAIRIRTSDGPAPKDGLDDKRR